MAEAPWRAYRRVGGPNRSESRNGFLGFLLDPLILDVAILLLGAQLLLFNGQIRAFLVSAYSGITCRLSAFRLRR